MSFGCDSGQRTGYQKKRFYPPFPSLFLPEGVSNDYAQVDLELPCSWHEWPVEGFTLPDSCWFTGTGTLLLTTENWCELAGDGTAF